MQMMQRTLACEERSQPAMAATAREWANRLGESNRSSLEQARLLPPESKLRPDRCDSMAVQYLEGTSEDNRLLYLDMAGIELLETRGFGKQLHRIVRTYPTRFNPG